MRVFLEVQSGSQAGREIELISGQSLSIGRGAEAQLSFPDDSFMSARHCSVRCGVAVCSLRDENSRNGVVLNGTRIQSAEAKNGDEFVVGATRFRVRVRATSSSFESGHRREFLDGGYGRLFTGEFQPLYAVLDAARDPRILALLEASQAEYRSLYEGKRGERMARVAAYLVGLNRNSTLLKALNAEGRSRSWGILLTCDRPFAEVRRHMRRFLSVQMPGGEKGLFRFYDPRVLTAFLPTCTWAEALAFFGPVKTYWAEQGPDARLTRWEKHRVRWRTGGIQTQSMAARGFGATGAREDRSAADSLRTDSPDERARHG